MGWSWSVGIYLFYKTYCRQMYLWSHNFPTPFIVILWNLHLYVISNILLWWCWWYANRIYYLNVCQCMKNTFTLRYISDTTLDSWYDKKCKNVGYFYLIFILYFAGCRGPRSSPKPGGPDVVYYSLQCVMWCVAFGNFTCYDLWTYK